MHAQTPVKNLESPKALTRLVREHRACDEKGQSTMRREPLVDCLIGDHCRDIRLNATNPTILAKHAELKAPRFDKRRVFSRQIAPLHPWRISDDVTNLWDVSRRKAISQYSA